MLKDALEGLRIVDAHHHLWDLSANYYPWLTDRITERVCGDYAAIRRDYRLADFRRDAAGLNLVKSVHVQAEHDPRDPVRETRWLQAIADDPDSDGFPHAVVAYADLAAPDIEAILEAHRESPNLRGIRQMLHEAYIDPRNPGRSPIDDPAWQRNVALLATHDLSFDLQVYPEQMDAAFTLLRQTPQIPFVLCHTGQPARRDADSLAAWQRGMRKLAQADNLAVKISGLGMFDRSWTIETVRPFILETIEIFGAARCLFASNFPVDGMMSGYGRLWSVYSEITADFSETERAALFAGNAERIYRI